MSSGNSTNEELTRYLLGEMSEEEQTEFEMRYFGDAQLFGELCAWRNNLIDRYVSNQLSPSMRHRFEAGIDKSWAINERIRFAETLQGEIDVRSAGVGSQRRPRFAGTRVSLRAWTSRFGQLAFVAAILLIVLGVGWLMIRSRRQGPVDGSDAGVGSSSSTLSDKSENDPNQARPDLTKSPSSSQTLTSDNSNSILTVPLTSDLAGTASDVRADVLVPPNIVMVKLVLIVDPPQDADYSAVVATSKDAEVFKAGSLRAQANETGNAVELFVPANRLPDGDYIIHLSGVTTNNQTISAGNYHLRVRQG